MISRPGRIPWATMIEGYQVQAIEITGQLLQ